MRGSPSRWRSPPRCWRSRSSSGAGVGQRLQAESRHLGASIVVSAEAFAAGKIDEAGSDRWVRHNGVRLRGRRETIDAYAYK